MSAAHPCSLAPAAIILSQGALLHVIVVIALLPALTALLNALISFVICRRLQWVVQLLRRLHEQQRLWRPWPTRRLWGDGCSGAADSCPSLMRPWHTIDMKSCSRWSLVLLVLGSVYSLVTNWGGLFRLRLADLSNGSDESRVGSIGRMLTLFGNKSEMRKHWQLRL